MPVQITRTRIARPNLGSFTIDPKSSDYKQLRPVCDPAHPWRCLIGTFGSMNLGKRLTAKLDHLEPSRSIIGITNGKWRWERPMTKDEIHLATQFDHGKRIVKPITVDVNLMDPAWTPKPKQVHTHPTDTTGKPRRASRQGDTTKAYVRGRQLEALKKAAAQRQQDAA